MSASYPNTIATLVNPDGTKKLGDPSQLHSTIETRQNEEIVAIETELGVGLKGSLSDLATRLAVSLNPDGTLKHQEVPVLLEDLADVDVGSGGPLQGQLLRYTVAYGWHNWTPNYLTADSLSSLVPFIGALYDVDLGSRSLTANLIKKTGGTSSQFLKADGSVDSNAYLYGTIPIANGGTGQTTQQSAINALTAVSGATGGYVLTKNLSTGHADWEIPFSNIDGGFANSTYTVEQYINGGSA